MWYKSIKDIFVVLSHITFCNIILSEASKFHRNEESKKCHVNRWGSLSNLYSCWLENHSYRVLAALLPAVWWLPCENSGCNNEARRDLGRYVLRSSKCSACSHGSLSILWSPVWCTEFHFKCISLIEWKGLSVVTSMQVLCVFNSTSLNICVLKCQCLLCIFHFHDSFWRPVNNHNLIIIWLNSQKLHLRTLYILAPQKHFCKEIERCLELIQTRKAEFARHISLSRVKHLGELKPVCSFHYYGRMVS